MTIVSRHLARFLIVSICGLGFHVPMAQAELIATDRVAAPGTQRPARARLESLFARDDVRAELVRRGVNPADARARIDALSDEEVERLNGQIDALPAGAGLEGALWILFLAFIVLLITDILGYTKVFSFTRPAK